MKQQTITKDDCGVVYHLDKDILFEGNKVYSPTTCKFVLPKDNSVKANAKHYTFLSPKGVVTKVYNLTQFSKENGLLQSDMCAVNKGKRKSSKGWTRYITGGKL